MVKGWHKYKHSDMEGQMALADVIVVNYALHYHGDPAKGLGTMARVLRGVLGVAPGSGSPGRAAEGGAAAGGV